MRATSPASGAVLPAAPRQVVFTFSERVEGSFGALRVVDDRGRRVDDGRVSRPAGRDDQLAVGVRAGTGRGAYAATYRVVSADGHPVSGGVTFVVGRGVTAAPPDVSALSAQAAAPAGVGTALSVARVVRYLGIGAAGGLLTLLLVVWAPLQRRGAVPAAADAAFGRRAVRGLRLAALVGGVGALAALVLQTANAGATGVVDALRPGALGDVLGTRTGLWFALSAVAFVVVGALAPAAVRSARPGRTPASAAVLVALGLLVVAPALGGHALASSPAWALVPLQVVHVAGMSAWLGGLLGLLLVLPRAAAALPAGRERTALLAGVLVRFSPVALVAVGVLTAAGTVLAILHLTTLYDLTDTAYGRAILVKALLLVAAIAVAVVQREFLVPRLRRAAERGGAAESEGPAGSEGAAEDEGAAEGRGAAEGEDPADPGAAGRHVRTALRTEVALLVAVLAATGALAGYAPPKSQGVGPVAVVRTAGDVQLQLTVDPARTGPNALRLDALDRRGRPLRGVRELRVRAVPPGRAGGSDVPVDVAFVPAGPGRWSAAAVPLGTPGGWTVDVVLRTGAFDQVEAELPVRVR
nr:copper resistance protein CopC [Patulibacter sp. SYSU D01012]